MLNAFPLLFTTKDETYTVRNVFFSATLVPLRQTNTQSPTQPAHTVSVSFTAGSHYNGSAKNHCVWSTDL